MKAFFLVILYFSTLFSSSTPFFNNAVRKNEPSSYESLILFVHNHTYSGTYDNWNNDNLEYKLLYNEETLSYARDICFYEGDFFNIYLNAVGYFSFSEELDSSVEESFASNYLTRYPGTDNFYVNRSGIYHFEISVLSLTAESDKLYKIWETDNCFISYIGNSAKKEARGNADIYLHRTYDGGLWSSANIEETRFVFNPSISAYEKTVNLFRGDVFCPYYYNEGYLKMFNNSWAISNLLDNDIEVTSFSYFSVSKTGTYKISIQSNVEYLCDKSFTWSKDGGSRITFLSDKRLDISCLGNETIAVVGSLKGHTYNTLNPFDSLVFDAFTKSYRLTLDLFANDYFCFYMKNTGKYIDMNDSDEYSSNILTGSGISYKAISGLNYFLVSQPGIYEVVISGNVERLVYPKDIWRLHGNSYVRLLQLSTSKDISCSYFVVDKTNLDSYSLTLSGDNGYYQFGIKGICFWPVQYFVGQYAIIKVSFDRNISNHYIFKYFNGEEDAVAEGSLIENNCYFLFGDNGGIDYYKSCDYLYNVLDLLVCERESDALYFTISNDKGIAKDLLRKYDKMSTENKQFVNGFVFPNIEVNNYISDVNYDFLHNEIIKAANNHKDLLYFLVLSSVSLFIVTAIGFCFICSKKRA